LQLNSFPHRRKNILTGEWILVSPHRTKRPWQGEVYSDKQEKRPKYDPGCYLCPGNKRANGEVNPDYKSTFVFTNDFPALLEDVKKKEVRLKDLLIAKSEKGICCVVNFSPRHDLTLADMKENDIEKVIEVWKSEYENLGSISGINNVQIFENKGAMMGNSNPHPHCQIWAQSSIPMEISKETKNFKKYFAQYKRSVLSDYLKLEINLGERIVYTNSSFVVVVPFWAVWPFETMIIPKRKIVNVLQLTSKEKKDFAIALKATTSKCILLNPQIRHNQTFSNL